MLSEHYKQQTSFKYFVKPFSFPSYRQEYHRSGCQFLKELLIEQEWVNLMNAN